MEERLIEFNTAELAKKKGFDLNCRFLYKSKLGWEEGIGVDYNWNRFNSYSAPTQSFLQTWLREIHDIHIQILIYSWSERTYYYKIHSKRAYVSNSSKFILDSDVVIGKYVDVLEKALHHGLNLIKE